MYTSVHIHVAKQLANTIGVIISLLLERFIYKSKFCIYICNSQILLHDQLCTYVVIYLHLLLLHNYVFHLIVTSSCLNDTSSDGSLNDNCSDDNNGVIAALTTLLVITLIGLLISVVIIALFVVKHKQLRYICYITIII